MGAIDQSPKPAFRVEARIDAKLSINATAKLHMGDSAPQKTLDIVHDKHNPTAQKAD
jgi:hypothetical protein